MESIFIDKMKWQDCSTVVLYHFQSYTYFCIKKILDNITPS